MSELGRARYLGLVQCRGRHSGRGVRVNDRKAGPLYEAVRHDTG
jgi:hypothetical protein